MQLQSAVAFLLALLATTLASANVTVTSPQSGGVFGSPVRFSGTATSSTCSKGVASMGVYVDNSLEYVVNGASLNTTLPIGAGNHNAVMEEWDYCGGATFTPIALSITNQTGVWVTSPKNNSTVNASVNYAATAATTTCSAGVASMGVYVNNQLKYVSQGAALNTTLTLTPGTNHTVVEEWDRCGGASYTPVTVTVGSGNTLSNLQASGAWKGYGEFPPSYGTCTSCGSGVTWYASRGLKSPALSGNATQFAIAGTTPYADVLWTNPLIGDFSSQGIPDPNHTLVSSLHNFTYDVDFYGGNLELSQVLEFDINQYFGGMAFTFGQQCRIAGGHEWDIWDNLGWRWVPTGIACNPASNQWNHLTIQAQRTWDNHLLYQSITLNGVTSNINQYYSPFSVPGWNGITVNFQMDGNYQQAPYSVILDNFSFSYW